MGSLPGQSFFPLGAIGQAMAWSAAYLGLRRVYDRTQWDGGAPPQGVSHRLGVCLLLALASTQVVRLLLTEPVWFHLYYIRFLVPVTLVVTWCALLLHRPTAELLRATSKSPALAPWAGLALILAVAAILVCGADFAFEHVAASITMVSRRTIQWSALITNVLILFSVYAVVFGLTSRVTAAVLLVSPLYILLGAATLMKMKYMHSAVQPLDLLRLPEFAPLLHRFFDTPALLLAGALTVLWCGAVAATCRAEPTRFSIKGRWSLGVASLTLLVAVPAILVLAPTFPPAASLTRQLGAPDGHWKDRTRRSGFLLSFLSDLPAALVTTPPDYSHSAVAGVLERHLPSSDRISLQQPPRRVNLIVYLVESLMDPADLGLRYTSDPIPNLRALSDSAIAGHVIVPEAFGGSANTEFELLTGMTRSFLPEGSVPYRQHVRHPIPSLARVLRRAGYTTTAIQPDPRHWYDRERIYPLLGFDQVIWLDEKPGIDRDTRVDWPTDHAVVEAVIAASRGPRPFFTFAFPSATHSPYHTGAYSGSDLDVINADATDKRGEVKEYVNAIHRADQAIGALVHHFRRRPDSTVIVVLGDHLPPLSEGARYTFTQRVSQASPAEQARLLHRVPLLIWANFALPRESQELSVNALPSFLLEKLAIPPTGFFAMAATIRRTMPVVGKYVTRSNGTVWSHDSLPVDLKALLHDYELLQYDLLLGKRYSLREGITELLRRPFYSPVPGALLSHQDDFHLVSRSEIGQRRVVAEASILQIPD